MRAFSSKQKALIVAAAFCLNAPTMVLIFRYSSGFSPRQVGAVGMLNLALGVPLLVLIAKKWIRRMR